MSRSEWALAILALTSACTPALRPPPKSRVEATVVKPEPATAPTSLSAGALPNAPTLAIVAEGASAVLHIDAARLRQSPLYSAYRETVRKLDQDPLAAARVTCGFDPLESVELVTWSGSAPGGRGRDLSGAAALAVNRPASEVASCISKLFDGVSAEVVGSIVVAGDPASVAQGVKRLQSGAPAAVPDFAKPALSFPGAAMTGALRMPPGQSGVPVTGGELVVAPLPERFLLHTELELESRDAALAMEKKIDPKRMAIGGIQLLIGKQRTWVKDRRLVHELVIEGDAAEQARQIGVLAALGVHGMRQYLGRSKEAEAKLNVMAIARGLLHELEAGKPVPASAPRTPRDVPRGAAVASEASWWKHPTWAFANFSIEGKQYFAYEIESAANRQKIVVRAVGDLDGDGVFSKYAVTLSRGKDGRWALDPDLSIDNALE
ncbi:MAG: hypothetical protein HYZ29_14695 [Myxococcales bacterium]|nr:hypothetical protein [Myxococcales bacterium]